MSSFGEFTQMGNITFLKDDIAYLKLISDITHYQYSNQVLVIDITHYIHVISPICFE